MEYFQTHFRMAKSGNQTETGKAFEYACAYVLFQKYNTFTKVSLIESAQMNTARNAFEHLPNEHKMRYMQGAEAAVRIVDRLEPQLSKISTPMAISLQTDSKGIAGDVRDVLCIRGTEWEIGLSCKHNHEAVKHSRLSDTIDFGHDWFNKKCSEEYFDNVRKVFTPLRTIRDESKANGSPALWNVIGDKETECYVPVLEAFMKELRRLDSEYPGEIPERLIRYLIGTNDFYKVIMNDQRGFTQIESININGSLNQSDGKRKALVDVPLMKMPTKFYEIGFKEGSRNTIVVVCDCGWNVSMRIHNASSKIEPSLKFDVQLLAMPSSILTQIEPWRECELYKTGTVNYSFEERAYKKLAESSAEYGSGSKQNLFVPCGAFVKHPVFGTGQVVRVVFTCENYKGLLEYPYLIGSRDEFRISVDGKTVTHERFGKGNICGYQVSFKSNEIYMTIDELSKGEFVIIPKEKMKDE